MKVERDRRIAAFNQDLLGESFTAASWFAMFSPLLFSPGAQPSELKTYIFINDISDTASATRFAVVNRTTQQVGQVLTIEDIVCPAVQDPPVAIRASLRLEAKKLPRMNLAIEDLHFVHALQCLVHHETAYIYSDQRDARVVMSVSGQWNVL